jgi:hypothetical protein
MNRNGRTRSRKATEIGQALDDQSEGCFFRPDRGADPFNHDLAERILPAEALHRVQDFQSGQAKEYPTPLILPDKSTILLISAKWSGGVRLLVFEVPI